MVQETGVQGRLRSLGGAQMAAITGLIVAIVAILITVAFDAERVSLLYRVQTHLAHRELSALIADRRDVMASDDHVSLGWIIRLGGFALSVVTFLVWFSRAYSNLPALGADRLRYGRGWAIGSWFIPFVSWVVPKRVANDIWRGSEPRLGASVQPDWFASPPPLLNMWWAVWILGGVLSGFERLVGGTGVTVSGLLTKTWVHVVASLVTCAAGVLAILVVHRLSANQELRARALSERVDSASAGRGPLAVGT